VPQFKSRDLLFALAAGLLLWGALHPRQLAQFVPSPGARISIPQFDAPNFNGELHIEVEVGWFAELGERFVWSSMRLAEKLSQGAVRVAHGLRPSWNRSTPPAAEIQHVRTVVVDPGHGGRDPGATGIGGLREKRVTLRVSRALRSELEARGFRVITTRYGDQTVSLRRRIAIAEQQGGDLFVSLHANAAPQSDVHGILTYYPDKSYARHTLRVAARDSATQVPRLDPAVRPFIDSNFSQMSDLSAVLADSVHQRVISSVREQNRAVPDRGVRSGPFYVLFLSSMPSVLLEMGFLTHRDEAILLQNDTYVSLLAEAIADGIACYRDDGNLDRTQATASLAPAAAKTDGFCSS
jgi:N-acetylmuramoyl-L-alanine amidase